MAKLKRMLDVLFLDLALGKDFINRTIRYTIYLSLILSPILVVLEIILSVQQGEFLITNIYAGIYMLVVFYAYLYIRMYHHKHKQEALRYSPASKKPNTIK